MSGVWNAASSAPFNVGLMLLLTDGSVLAQNTGTSLWWRLRPDRAGRYPQGEWKATAASKNAPLYFASAVLADGNVFVAGGEYSNNASKPSDLCTAECYDPVGETWSSLSAPPGWTAIGDAPCCVLPDGRVLIGNINAGPCSIWDPVAGAWSATDPKLNGSSSEETWTLLPDGSVLTADCVGEPASERFVGNAWIANGATPVSLVEAASSEIGPAILLPDGSVFALGATGATARFSPSANPTQPGVWTAGPGIPKDAGGAFLGAKDAPGCLLPNGRVLCAVGPVDGTADKYAGPTTFFEFDPAGAGAWSAALPAPPGDTGLAPYAFCFLLLPTGQVMVSNGTRTVQVYQPDGAADVAWAPTIESCPTTLQAGSTNPLHGTQLNGLSQACSYGDDAAMATNYPLVRMRAPFPSDTVIYCRTFGHSTMGVATGHSIQKTNFVAPSDLAAGVYYLSVVANGVASAETPVSVTTRVPRRQQQLPGGISTLAESATFAQDELFLRDLSEVHLLMDFVSGRADRSLAGLKDAPTFDAGGNPVGSMPSQQVVEEICKITYPPDGGPESNAQQAAFMLVVKDRLNYLAAPARGMTVAFTSMFSGVSLEFAPWSWFASPGSKKNESSAGMSSFSAKNAYPNLESPARKFRNFYRGIPVAAFFLVFLITFVNWDISVTSGMLQQISTGEANYEKLFKADQGFRPTPTNCPSKIPAEAAACFAAHSALAQIAAGRVNLQNLMKYRSLRPIELSVRVFGAVIGGPPAQPLTQSQDGFLDPWPLEGLTLAVMNAFNSVIIPGAFGLLGTLAGLTRSITGKARDSVLSPRDYGIARVAIFLGMSAGLAVGLFFNAADPSGAVGKSLGTTITVTVAGLSFLAGFGAEGFFTFLDGLVTRLFSASQPPLVPTQGMGAPPR